MNENVYYMSHQNSQEDNKDNGEDNSIYRGNS